MALNFAEAVWVRCEIAQINMSRGHYYLELIEKEDRESEITAKSSGVIWEQNYKKIKKERGKEISALLNVGMEVQLKVQVDFHEKFGLKLIVVDVDPTFTLGKLELKRRQTVQLLKEKKLIEKNKLTNLPKVVQKIAIISSKKAAGLQDFLNHISENDYKYAFHCELFESTVQGEKVEIEMVQGLKSIQRDLSQFDCVVIIRGGGGRMDLSAFDSYELSKSIAEFPLPVLTGIGHDFNESVVDMVAHSALKTPTAVADFIIENNLKFESEIAKLAFELKTLFLEIVRDGQIHLIKQTQHFFNEISIRVQKTHHMVDFIDTELPSVAQQYIRNNSERLNKCETIIGVADPEKVLERGFTITTQNGKYIKSKKDISIGESIKTLFQDGEIESIVKKTNNE